MMSRAKAWWFKKSRMLRWMAGIAALLFLAGGFLLFLSLTMGKSLEDQNAAFRWAADGKRYAQVSAYFPAAEGISENSIDTYRFQLQKGLEEASASGDTKGGRKQWSDAYSREGVMTVSRGKESVEATAIGCGGNFFLFHPVRLLSGAYFRESDVMHDRVLIDEETAWRLFGSSDVSGMTVYIQEKEFLVAGVFTYGEGRTQKKAKQNRPVMFLLFDTFQSLSGDGSLGGGAGEGGADNGNSGVSGSSEKAQAGGVAAGTDAGGQFPAPETGGGITCYEAALPNPVSGFAKNLLVKAVAGLDLSEEEKPEEKLLTLSMEFVENSDRFSIPSLWKTLGRIGIKSMKQEATFYPYWENEALAVEDYSAVLFLASGLLLLPSSVVFLILLVRRFRRRKWTFAYCRKKLEDRIEKRRKKKWEEKKQSQKEKTGS